MSGPQRGFTHLLPTSRAQSPTVVEKVSGGGSAQEEQRRLPSPELKGTGCLGLLPTLLPTASHLAAWGYWRLGCFQGGRS